MICKVKNKLWIYPGDAAWHFVYVDGKVAEAIKKRVGEGKRPRRGFGAVKVEVNLGESVWQTSLFPDKRSGAYLLPVKASVRRAEGLQDGDTLKFTLRLV